MAGATTLVIDVGTLQRTAFHTKQQQQPRKHTMDFEIASNFVLVVIQDRFLMVRCSDLMSEDIFTAWSI